MSSNQPVNVEYERGAIERLRGHAEFWERQDRSSQTGHAISLSMQEIPVVVSRNWHSPYPTGLTPGPESGEHPRRKISRFTSFFLHRILPAMGEEPTYEASLRVDSHTNNHPSLDTQTYYKDPFAGTLGEAPVGVNPIRMRRVLEIRLARQQKLVGDGDHSLTWQTIIGVSQLESDNYAFDANLWFYTTNFSSSRQEDRDPPRVNRNRFTNQDDVEDVINLVGNIGLLAEMAQIASTVNPIDFLRD